MQNVSDFQEQRINNGIKLDNLRNPQDFGKLYSQYKALGGNGSFEEFVNKDQKAREEAIRQKTQSKTLNSNIRNKAMNIGGFGAGAGMNFSDYLPYETFNYASLGYGTATIGTKNPYAVGIATGAGFIYGASQDFSRIRGLLDGTGIISTNSISQSSGSNSFLGNTVQAYAYNTNSNVFANNNQQAISYNTGEQTAYSRDMLDTLETSNMNMEQLSDYIVNMNKR